jgi:hypothetical protein
VRMAFPPYGRDEHPDCTATGRRVGRVLPTTACCGIVEPTSPRNDENENGEAGVEAGLTTEVRCLIFAER